MIAAVGFIVAPAAAQSPVPAGQSPQAGPLIPRYVAAQKVGGCVVRHNPKVATRFVISGSDDRADRASPLNEVIYAAEPCLAGSFASVHFNGVEMRGAIAEALLKDKNAVLLRQVRVASPRPPERVAPPTVDGPNFALFDCAVGVMPAASALLLDAAPTTPGEAAAFQAIGPALQACAPLGFALHIRPSNVRWLVATSLYRLAAANSGS